MEAYRRATFLLIDLFYHEWYHGPNHPDSPISPLFSSIAKTCSSSVSYRGDLKRLVVSDWKRVVWSNVVARVRLLLDRPDVVDACAEYFYESLGGRCRVGMADIGRMDVCLSEVLAGVEMNVLSGFDVDEDEMIEEVGEEGDRGMETEAEELHVTPETIMQVSEALVELGWMPYLTEEFDAALLRRAEAILEEYKMEFTESCLPKLRRWFQTTVLPWLCVHTVQRSNHPENSVDALQKLVSKHEQALMRCFFDMRAREMFDIIVDYPDSVPAIEELKFCLDHFKLGQILVRYLANSLKQRLLHPGATTSTVIDQYISTVRVMLMLDPRGVLLDSVSRPIRVYLRQREDTVKEIIFKLFDDTTEGGLAEELSRETPILMKDEQFEDDFLDENWVPPSREFEYVPVRNAEDILNSLVNIYDSKDVFVEQFQKYLAEKLLTIADYQNEKEIGYVEMLKVRFGEGCMQQCEVMIKDVSDSRRVDAMIHDGLKSSGEAENVVVHCLMLSHLFWPRTSSLGHDDEKVKFPEGLRRQLDAYAEKFQVIKGSRELRWHHQQGTVELDLEMDDGTTVEVTCTPQQAAVIYLFEDRDVVNIDILTDALEMTVEEVKHKMSFWIGKGVIKEVGTGRYELQSGRSYGDDDGGGDEHQQDGDDDAQQDQADAERMAPFWPYISAMLTNLGPLPAGRIHSMLSMFVQAPNKYDRSDADLQQYLDMMVQDDKLDAVNGSYRLK